MKVYTVGGAVRDELLGLPVKDRDYVVVGGTPEELIAKGFKPVGKDFPVFLHPDTAEEYALARTERKTAPGYAGFQFHAAPDVTLEQDLARRDLTINALARDEAGQLIDPYGGLADLRAGVLRHVSPAFSEDPVRILRVARFAARFGFAPAPETMTLMRGMAQGGEVDALVAERVWQEIAKGLMERQPSRMFDILRACGALERVWPQWALLHEAEALAAVDRAALADASLRERYAVLWSGVDADVADAAAQTVRAPSECRDLALLAARYGPALRTADEAAAPALVDALQRTDAFRRPDRFEALVRVAGWAGAHQDPSRLKRAASRLQCALEAAKRVDAASIAKQQPGDIAGALRLAREQAVATALLASG